MADLTPIPFSVLIRRLFHELEAKKSAFLMPRWKFARAAEGLDLSTTIFGRRAATPFGPAAGPHTQLAQNIVLSWLAGGRVIELKTVQILDRLVIPRPCIDMETVGFNIEWSQELTLEQSLAEYVKAAMLIEMLKADGLAPGLEATVIDMSAGYDLAGIRSPEVRAFLDGLKDARRIVERLKAEIPAPYARFRDLDYPTSVSDSITLSTFHGCPPEEIEAIAAHLMEEVGLDVVVKLNPTLLGRDTLNRLLHDRLGYHELNVSEATFAKDATWEQMTGIVTRLGDLATRTGRGFGVKFTNTLLVENHKSFFPKGTKEMYLSGTPLHVLAITLVDRFRQTFGDRFPISFSAGIDLDNFAETVALGLKPVSVCTDLLKGAGYGKGCDYIADLADRMRDLGAPDLDTYALLAFGQAEAALASLGEATQTACRAALASGGDLRAAAGGEFDAWVSAARVRNSGVYAAKVVDDPRYRSEANAEGPHKTGVPLAWLDCETCGKCVTACPNAAIFRYALPKIPMVTSATVTPGAVPSVVLGPPQAIRMKQQIGIHADICNACGNCDVICPESGGPHATKINVFGSLASLMEAPSRDGFTASRVDCAIRVTARLDGRIVTLYRDGDRIRMRGEGFDFSVARADPADLSGTAEREVDLGQLLLVDRIAEAVGAPDAHTFLSAVLL